MLEGVFMSCGLNTGWPDVTVVSEGGLCHKDGPLGCRVPMFVSEKECMSRVWCLEYSQV